MYGFQQAKKYDQYLYVFGRPKKRRPRCLRLWKLNAKQIVIMSWLIFHANISNIYAIMWRVVHVPCYWPCFIIRGYGAWSTPSKQWLSLESMLQHIIDIYSKKAWWDVIVYVIACGIGKVQARKCNTTVVVPVRFMSYVSCKLMSTWTSRMPPHI